MREDSKIGGRMSSRKRSFKRIRKSNSTGTMRIANVRPLPLSSLKAPLNLTTINVENYRIYEERRKLEMKDDSVIEEKSPRKSIKLKITDSFRKGSSEGKILKVKDYNGNKPGISDIVIKLNRDSVEFSPGNIPSWPVATSTPKNVIDPLAKADKYPRRFALESINVNRNSPEMQKVDAGHTPPVPHKWQVKTVENPRRAERLAELNKSMEHSTRISSKLERVKSFGMHMTGKRHARECKVAETVTPKKSKKSGRKDDKSPYNHVKGRLYTKNAGCTPPRIREKKPARTVRGDA